jgi:hypothetical protein
MVNIRKLVAVDMVLHGTRFIVAEFAIGVILLLVLGYVSIFAGFFNFAQSGLQTVIGYWMLGIAVNYIPLFIYAVLIARGGTVKAEGEPELVHIKRYNVQQLIVFIPLLIALVALIQEVQRQKT